MKKTFLIIASLLLAGCQSISTSVSRFNAFETVSSKRFRVTSGDKSLEAQAYAQAISDQLTKLGWQPSTAAAEIEVRFGFAIDSGRNHSSMMPIYGQTGGGTTYSSGTVYSGGRVGTYSGSSYTAPTYGVVAAIPVNTTMYKRVLKVEMIDTRKRAQMFEGTVTSEGTTGTIPPIASCLIEAMFKDFPGTSGSTVQYNLPYESCRPK
jgi:hypothetical protein